MLLLNVRIIICMTKFYMGDNVKIRDIISLTNVGVKFSRSLRNLLMAWVCKELSGVS